MAWTSLKSTLTDKPLMLAGPMLRKVTKQSATVWMALRKPSTVTLTVVNDQNALMLSGEGKTVAVGQNLHIVAVTAKPVNNAQLTEGVVYQYDLSFDMGNSTMGLAGATNNAQLSYGHLQKPSFALPPADLNSLRILHGSCRMPHADGKDTMPLIDDLISETAANAYARPHQLLLTGDQIYADDVSDAMLTMLIDATNALLGWQEAIPGVVGTMFVPPIGACMRSSVLGGPDMGKFQNTPGFTSEDLKSHLMSLGEYLSMYLFVWSDVVWPPSLPTFDDVAAEVYKVVPRENVWQWKGAIQLDQTKIETNNKSVSEFFQSLYKVRRALANVPTYTIFDDHEITDDWNMTPTFCHDVYGNELGKRVVQNGLLAYALCQHWGNKPEDFVGSALTSAGVVLLTLIDTLNPTVLGAFQQKAADYDHNSANIRSLLGLHDAAAIQARLDRAVYHDALSLRYNYTIEGDGHQVIVTDTRTWRAFPTKSDAATHLLTKNTQTDQFQEQFLATPLTNDRQLIVVVTTNAPPVQPIRSTAQNDSLTNHLAYYPDVYEAWDLPSVSFDRLLVALSSKLPPDGAGQLTGAVVMLSGDVHHSFASRIIYRAKKRYEDTTGKSAAAVFAQLVASSFKKQSNLTVGFQREGYFSSPHPRITQRMIRHAMFEGYVGWSALPGSGNIVGVQLNDDEDEELVQLKVATTVDVTPRYTVVKLGLAPEYRYRLDYLLPSSQTVQVGVPPPIASPGATTTPDQRKQAAQAWDAAMSAYRMYNLANPPKVVGVNNFGEIKFEGASATTRKVNHIVRWWDLPSASPKITTYTVRLDVNLPNDPDFPDIRAVVEPAGGP